MFAGIFSKESVILCFAFGTQKYLSLETKLPFFKNCKNAQSLYAPLILKRQTDKGYY